MAFHVSEHVVHAFYQAMKELNEEGGITARYKRYQENHQILGGRYA